MKRGKKAQQTFEMFSGLSAGLLALALMLVIGFLVIAQGESVSQGLIAFTTTTNETINVTNTTNSTFITLANVNAIWLDFSCTQVSNNTANTAVSSETTFTCDRSNGIRINVSGLDRGSLPLNATGKSMFVNYRYRQPDSAVNASFTLANAMDDVAPFAPIVVIAAIGAALLLLIGVLFRRNR
jgi:hypothetical protein